LKLRQTGHLHHIRKAKAVKPSLIYYQLEFDEGGISMKQKLYYAIPFAAVPLLLLLCEVLDNMNLLQMSPYILGAMLLLFSVAMGFFSTTHRTFDYLLTAIMPLSLFCCMFVGGFLDKSDLETRFHLYKAVNAAFQPIALLLYLLMAIVTFLASFKRLRNIKNHT
jgi:hypothetical protein